MKKSQNDTMPYITWLNTSYRNRNDVRKKSSLQHTCNTLWTVVRLRYCLIVIRTYCYVTSESIRVSIAGDVDVRHAVLCTHERLHMQTHTQYTHAHTNKRIHTHSRPRTHTHAYTLRNFTLSDREKIQEIENSKLDQMSSYLQVGYTNNDEQQLRSSIR